MWGKVPGHPHAHISSAECPETSLLLTVTKDSK